MKNINKISLVGLTLVLAICGCNENEALEKALEEKIPMVFERADKQFRTLMELTLQETEKAGEWRLPRTYEGGTNRFANVTWWTSGFFPGSMWYLYEYTKDGFWLENAVKFTECQKPITEYVGNHDIGFMLYCSAGNALRLTGDREKWGWMLEKGAKNLCSRFQEDLGLILSWNSHTNQGNLLQRPVIIDNMMNLELLEWARKNADDKRAGEVSMSHALETSRRHFRNDSSAFHVVDYRFNDRNVFAYHAGQGASAAGTWARGQAWAIYGFTMMARETKNAEILDRAVKCADWWINAKPTPDDFIPYWDYSAVNIPNEERDASAAAITASGLLELSEIVGGAKGRKYRTHAVKMLSSLASDEYLASEGTNGGFLLKHSTGHKPVNSEVDVPLTYADYYFLEALLRFKALRN